VNRSLSLFNNYTSPSEPFLKMLRSILSKTDNATLLAIISSVTKLVKKIVLMVFFTVDAACTITRKREYMMNRDEKEDGHDDINSNEIEIGS